MKANPLNLSNQSSDDNFGRIHSLDLCRGLCAIGVVAYHFSLWGGTNFPQFFHSIVMLFGTYGVSVFFILSGYSLAHAYDNHFSGRIDLPQLAVYVRRRVGRIAPLFIAILILTLIGKALIGESKSIEPLTVIANATLLFGFYNPASTPVIGGWSIGVEVVFYLIFPLLLVLRKQVLVMLVSAVFMTMWISSDISRLDTLADGWMQYVSPANHWVFFCAGVYARLYAGSWIISTHKVYFLITIIVLFALWTSLGASELQIVTGWYRALFVVLSVVLVALLGKISLRNALCRRFSIAMGGASYSLYLAHPLIFFGLRSKIDIASISAWVGFVIGTVIIAYFIDRYVDSYVQRSLKRIGW